MTTMTLAGRSRIFIANALFGTAVAALAVLPAAAASLDPPQATIQYGDLNLDNPRGAEMLYARIRRAAESVCGQFERDRLNLHEKREACIDQAISGAVTKVNAPVLSAVHGAKTSKTVATRLVSRPVAR